MAGSKRFDLSGRAALVTGSSRGIGRAIVLALAEHSADVAVHYASNADQAQQVVTQARQCGVRAFAVKGDLAAANATQEVFSQTVEHLGRIDILVLNASTQVRSSWAEIERADFDVQMAVNVWASLHLARLALPGMIERKWGRVLTIGSIQQARPLTSMVIYAASKHAQLNAALNLARQVAAHGVTINNLAPGAIETDRNRDALADPLHRKEILAQIPAGRLGRADDCVGAALLLCSDAGSYITGADLYVDGGMHL